MPKRVKYNETGTTKPYVTIDWPKWDKVCHNFATPSESNVEPLKG